MPVQRSFNAGEFSPHLYGQKDFDRYANAAKTVKNMICLPHGPVVRRPGLQHIDNLGSVSNLISKTLLIPFIYSAGQSYMLVANVYVWVPGPPTTYFDFTPYYNGGYVEAPGGGKLTIETTDKFWPSDAAQSADVLFMASFTGGTPHKITRVDHDDWTIGEIEFIDPPAEWATGGYGKSVCFSNERLIWAGSNGNPQTIWPSKVGVYTDHGVSDPLVDDDALTLVLSDKQANPIKWIINSRRLCVGTTGSENWITGSGGDAPITATSKQLTPCGDSGSGDVNPVVIGNTVLFVDEHGRSIKELRYDYSTDSMAGEDLMILSDHLALNDPIIKIAIQKKPYKIIWAVTTSGKLLSGCYYPEQKVLAWSWHDTQGLFKDVATIPGNGQDEVYFIVERHPKDGSGNSTRVLYLERLGSFFEGDITEHQIGNNGSPLPVFCDSALAIDNRVVVTSITAANPAVFSSVGGASVGETVMVRGYLPDETVDDSIINRGLFTVGNGYTLIDYDGNPLDLSGHANVKSGGVNYAYNSSFHSNIITIAETTGMASGLDHLEGLEVSVLADGKAETATVSSGSITLPYESSVVVVGLPFTSQLETFTPREDESQIPHDPGATYRINGIIAHVYKSMGFKMGVNGQELFRVEKGNTPLGSAEALFTGYTDRIEPLCPYQNEPRVIIEQDQPYPLCVLAIHTDIERGD